MPGGGDVAPFVPQEHDVVSTKLRSWNLGHPGNLAYADLLYEHTKLLPSADSDKYTESLHEIAKRMVAVILDERGGRFLKIQEGEPYPDDCVVMDRRACVHKVVQGLKNKVRKGNPPTPTKRLALPVKGQSFKNAKYNNRPPPVIKDPLPRKRPKPKPKPVVVKPPPPPPKSEPSPTPVATRPFGTRIRKKRRRFSEDETSEYTIPTYNQKKRVRRWKKRPPIQYEAQQSKDGKINPYALELISTVCNHDPQAKPAHQLGILDRPAGKYRSPEEEPDQERLIRLQLRHRFMAAKSVKMPIVEFARKLLEVWGAKLAEITPEMQFEMEETKRIASADVDDIAGEQEGTGGKHNGIHIHGDDCEETRNDAEVSTEASAMSKRIPQKQPRKPPTLGQHQEMLPFSSMAPNNGLWNGSPFPLPNGEVPRKQQESSDEENSDGEEDHDDEHGDESGSEGSDDESESQTDYHNHGMHAGERHESAEEDSQSEEESEEESSDEEPEVGSVHHYEVPRDQNQALHQVAHELQQLATQNHLQYGSVAAFHYDGM